jgi:hypothetical protein
VLAVTDRAPGRFAKPRFGKLVRGAASRLPWAWDGLVFALPLTSADNEGLRELAANLRPAAVTGVTWTHDAQHNTAVVCTPASNTTVQWVDQPTHDRPSDAVTVYVRHRFSGAWDANGGLFTQKYADTDPWDTFIIQTQSPASGVHVGLAVSGVYQRTSYGTVTPPTSRYISYFGRWRSGGPVTLDALEDGGKASWAQTTSAAAYTGTLSYTAGQGVRLCTDEQGTLNVGGDYSQAMVWARRLSDAEVVALAADPFGWVSPRRETLVLASPFPVAAGLLPGQTSQQFVRLGRVG